MNARIVSITLLTLAFLQLACVNLVSASLFNYVAVVTYGTGVTDSSGILSFTVTSEGENTSLIWQKIDLGIQQYIVELHTNDIVTIDYRNCSVTYKSILALGDYNLISFTGEANSIAVNEAEIPEFAPANIMFLFIIATALAVLFYRKKRNVR